jgi:succinate dehydrogenase / fumarate reductase cytochrome b subunit
MATSTQKSTLYRIGQWFDPRGKDVGTFGFILNRITALGLTLYLYLHLVVLYQLSRGPEAYSNFLAVLHSPVFVFGEWLVVAAGLIHGFNGLRIALTSFGIVVPYQKQILYGLMVISIIGAIVFGVKMFTAL